MNDEKWLDIIGRIKDNPAISVTDQRVEDLPEDEGPGKIEILEFEGPTGSIRFERVTRPVVLDKKVTQSRRIGSEAKVEYLYSDTEVTHKFRAYRADGNGNWVEMEMDRGPMNF